LRNLLLFASGEGTTVQAVLDAIVSGELRNVRVVGLITDRDNAGVIQRVMRSGIPVSVIPAESEDAFAPLLMEVMARFKPDLILLAGYLRKIPAPIVQQYSGKMINTHPSLLPKYGGRGFYGDHIHKAVIAGGDTETGCTIHYVNEEYDSGDIILQTKIPVDPRDTATTLAEKVKREEKIILIQTLQQLLGSDTL
jgi:formyltetrahydrofolate-dependent phosphoribosylglycinamide formyltransferase